MSTTDDSVTIARDDLDTLLWAAQQHGEWRREWEDSEAQHYPEGQYEKDTDDLDTTIARVREVTA